MRLKKSSAAAVHLTAALLGIAVCAWGQTCPGDARQSWQAEIRRRVEEKNLLAALEVAQGRLQVAPADLEARGWRARLLAWSGRWSEAETEYRRVLESAPRDTDILTGLADVLTWQQRPEEALALLVRAREFDPTRADVQVRRGRILRGLGRTEEARSAFAEALRLEPGNADARAGWDSVRPAPRNQFVFGSDFDFYNATVDAQAVTASLRSRLSSRWTTNFSGSFYNRFLEKAAKFSASATRRVSKNDSFSAGGAAAHDQGVIPRTEAFFEYAHGFRLEGHGFVRGLEANYRQHWLWFSSARVLVLTPSALVYLPRDWTWSFSISPARSRFPGTAAEWRPSGQTKLAFPLRPRLSGNVFFAVGTENFGRADQVGRFSARTWGGGMRFELTSRQDFSSYVLYQDRSQSRTQTSFGVSYGIRF